MKNYFLLLFFVLTFSSVKAQNVTANTYYATSELNIGNYFGLDWTLNYVIQNTYSIKVGFTRNIRDPKSKPDDYSRGLGFLSFSYPFDYFSTYKVELGKIYNLNQKGTIRANLALGVGYTVIEEPENWQYIPNNATVNLDENYTYDYYKYNTISLIISPKIEFPISKYFGFSVSPMAQINKDRNYCGVGLGIMLGKVRE